VTDGEGEDAAGGNTGEGDGVEEGMDAVGFLTLWITKWLAK